jgi:hypothetical protein
MLLPQALKTLRTRDRSTATILDVERRACQGLAEVLWKTSMGTETLAHNSCQITYIFCLTALAIIDPY